MKLFKNNKHGFSLVEALISLVIAWGLILVGIGGYVICHFIQKLW